MPFAPSELALKMEPSIAARVKENEKAGGNRAGMGRQKSDKAAIDIKKQLADLAGISHDTAYTLNVLSACARGALAEIL